MTEVLRTRISRHEAQIILDVLQSKKQDIEALQHQMEDLDSKVYHLKQQLRCGDTMVVKDLNATKAELADLKCQEMKLYDQAQLYEILIAKYTRLSQGSKGKGRYRRPEYLTKWWYDFLQRN